MESLSWLTHGASDGVWSRPVRPSATADVTDSEHRSPHPTSRDLVPRRNLERHNGPRDAVRMRSNGTTIAVSLIVAIAACTSGPDVVPRVNGAIVLTAIDREELTVELYSVNQDGSGFRQLTNDPLPDTAAEEQGTGLSQ